MKTKRSRIVAAVVIVAVVGALDQTQFLEPRHVRVHVRVVPARGLGQGVDAAGPDTPERAEQVEACRRQFGEQRAGRLEAEPEVRCGAPLSRAMKSRNRYIS